MREGISIRERLLGTDHPGVAVALINLAVILQTRGRYDEANLLIKRIQAIDENNFPANHQELAWT
jgi:hypothetical protein